MTRDAILYYGRLPWCDFWRSRHFSRLIVDNIVIRRGRTETIWVAYGPKKFATEGPGPGHRTAAEAARAYEDGGAPVRLRFGHRFRWVFVPSRGHTFSQNLVLVRVRDLRALVEPSIPDPEAP